MNPVRWHQAALSVICTLCAVLGGEFISGTGYSFAQFGDGINESNDAKIALARQTSTPKRVTPTPKRPTPVPQINSNFPTKKKPSSGVAAQIGFLGGGGGFGCPNAAADSKSLVMTITKPEYELGEIFSLCFSGYRQGERLELQLVRPDGSSSVVPVSADAAYMPRSLDWMPLPGDVPGTYTFSARQGKQRATASFRLRAASQPRIAVYPQSVVAGTTFRVILAGFRSKQAVPIHIYKSGGLNSPYYASLGITVDANGQAIMNIQTAMTDPVGGYEILPEGVDRNIVFGLNTILIQAPTATATATPSASGLWVGDGMLVVGVEPNSPAAQAGFQVGQILTSLNKMPVQTVATAREIFNNHRGEVVTAVITTANGTTKQLQIIPPATGPTGIDLCESGRCTRPKQ